MNDKNILSIYEGGVDDYVTNYDEDSDWDSDYNDYYDYYDYYDDYLPSDRHWSEDDSDWNSEYEDSDSNSEKPECDFSFREKLKKLMFVKKFQS